MTDPLAHLLALAGLVGEEARGAYVLGQLPGGRRDTLGNVWAGEGQILLLAHLDTVLPPVPPRRLGGRLYGPGVGDNSSGVAVLLSLPALPGVVRAFTVGEEGLGNLRGARALVEALRPKVVVAVDGYLPMVVDRALGSVRFRVAFLGPGGHAWGERGRPNPVLALAEAVAEAYRIHLSPVEASLNVGRLEGGEAVNAIPRRAEALLEVRSTDPRELSRLEEALTALFHEKARAHRLEVELEVLGRRPAGKTATSVLLEAARRGLGAVGERPLFVCGSTDASAGVEKGLPALGFGVYRGGEAHTPREWVEAKSLYLGQKALLAFLEALGVG
ncbi:MAG: peptidase M20 [Thermus sp.]|uniref:M20/M25/M40 family metallo-hydrolase n=1 Tax=Thermus sp. TaxID=275 RepID=UPI00332D8FC2